MYLFFSSFLLQLLFIPLLLFLFSFLFFSLSTSFFFPLHFLLFAPVLRLVHVLLLVFIDGWFLLYWSYLRGKYEKGIYPLLHLSARKRVSTLPKTLNHFFSQLFLSAKYQCRSFLGWVWDMGRFMRLIWYILNVQKCRPHTQHTLQRCDVRVTDKMDAQISCSIRLDKRLKSFQIATRVSQFNITHLKELQTSWWVRCELTCSRSVEVRLLVRQGRAQEAGVVP